MTEPRTFDERTHWDVWDRSRGVEGTSWNDRFGGWAMPSDASRYISFTDKYWGDVLDKARAAYGDPSIRFNSDDYHSERYLVFGDGTRLPTDGTVVYHDSATKQNWIQNNDGTVIPANADFRPTGGPIIPAGYRAMPDGRYAPVDPFGHQIA